MINTNRKKNNPTPIPKPVKKDSIFLVIKYYFIIFFFYYLKRVFY